MDPAAEHLAPLLLRLVNYERSRPDRRLWDLATMKRLLSRPGASAPPRPAVQVGGSKGKGTTCAFVEALTLASGRLPGTYLSPHVTTLLERCRVGGREIRVDELEPILRELLAGADGDRAPTFFEAMTLAAVEWFAARHVDLACYEVGLGGRYDATTAVPVDASIITTIELEHTDVLGPTIAAIAGEKAHVIRPGGVGFTATNGEALAVIRAHAAAVEAELFVMGEDFGLADLRFVDEGLRGELWLPKTASRRFFLPAAAAFEAPALALAAAAFVHLLPEAALVVDPVSRPDLPCRFEVFAEADGEVLILDGAHTEKSLAAVADEVRRRYPGRRASVLFASALGKRWREGLSALLPIADSFVVTALSGTIGEDPAAIASHLAARGAKTEVATDVESALACLRARPGPRLVVGSFYLAGRVREQVDRPRHLDDERTT